MFLLINKPSGPTSHDIINTLRRVTSIKRIGHAGTLDPFAQGLLVCALGRESTKLLNNFLKLDKTYLAVLHLGATSDTYDRTGKLNVLPLPRGGGPINIGPEGYRGPTKQIISSTLQKFIGPQLQTPPIFSAKKIHGQKAYDLARKNKPVALKPNKITIYSIKIKEFEIQNSKLEIEVHCTSGTYIRSLAHDLGQALGCGAYLTDLKRLAIGPIKLAQAVPLKKLAKDNWQKYVLSDLPVSSTKTRVLVFGTFDLLHQGHLNFLRQAQKLGDELYVVIARDLNVQAIKHVLPTEPELIRLGAVRNSTLPDNVLLGQLDFSKRFRVLGKIKPDIIALGYDQKLDLEALQAKIEHYHLTTKIVRLAPHHPEIYKSSLLRKKSPTLAKSLIL